MISLQIKQKIKHTDDDITKSIEHELKINRSDFTYEIKRRSLDARDKKNIFWLYTIFVTLKDKKLEEKIVHFSKGKITKAEEKKYVPLISGTEKLSSRPVVVGAGPAGLFAALLLTEYGFSPIILERGEDVEKRTVSVQKFWDTGILNENSNVQFGEGGAGTFSDGKLNTGVKDVSNRIGFVLDTFVKFGAAPDIKYSNKPHIGTDVLKSVIKNMREYMIKGGAEFKFNSCVTDIVTENGHIKGVTVNNKDFIESENVILAIGHSARDTFNMLFEKNIEITQKAFAVGLRIEHLQEKIGFSQYGDAYKLLPPADYKLTHTARDGRGVYSFCMCPGGFVVNASSETGKTCVNGMSNRDRNGKNANSAIVVQINPSDFDPQKTLNPLLGIEFQRRLEENCYKLAGGKIPVQRFEDFKLSRATSEFGEVIPYSKGMYEKSDLSRVLPKFVKEDIIEGVTAFENKIHGFSSPDAILSGIEGRTSAPVRITRSETFESNIKGLYPIGEGAGYAGGITSAAVDGIKVFEAIAAKYKPFGGN